MRLLLLFICLLFFTFATTAQWERTTGPEGQSINSLDYIDGIIYAGTTADGLFRSSDDGMTWEALNNGIEYFNIRGVVSLPGYLFVGTFGHGVYRSTDGGETWLPPSNATDVAVTSILVHDTILFISGVYDGVYRSMDHGVTWVQVIPEILSIDAMGISQNSIFASYSVYTIVSTDNGENWTYIDDLEGAQVSTFYVRDSLLLVGAVNEIYKSTDYGESFTNIQLNFPFGIVSINALTSLGSTLFMGTSYDGVYTSADGGYNWLPANQGMGPKDVRALAVTNMNTLIAGSHYVGVYRSTDMAATWNKSMTGLPAGSSMLAMMASGQNIFAGTRDGVFRTSDNGLTWTELDGDNDTINYSSVWGLCEKDGAIYAGTTIQFHATVYKSEDQGDTWVRSGTGLPADMPFIFGMAVSGDNILACGDDGVYYSPDDGANWLKSNAPSDYFSSIAASNNYAFVPQVGVGILRSSDFGINWSVVLPSTADYVEVAAMDNYAFAGTFFTGARYSDAYGLGWNNCNGITEGASVFEIQPFGDGMVLAGTDVETHWIYLSENYGAYFLPYSEGLGPNASTEAFAVSDTFLYAGTDYNGVWRRLRPEFVKVNEPVSNENFLALDQNRPNPFSSSTEIDFTTVEEGLVSLEVYNVLGEKVAALANDYRKPGNYREEFSASGLSPGIYFYRLSLNGQSVIKKMICTR